MSTPAPDEPTDVALFPRELIATPYKKLTNPQRKQQRAARVLMIRRWWAAGFEVDAIRRLAAVRFQANPRTIETLLGQVADDLDIEAEAYEQLPEHQIRHRHRVRIEDLYRRCIDEGKLSAAERCLRALAELDGVFKARQPNGDPLVKHILPMEKQGARMIPRDQMAEFLLRDDNDDEDGIVIDVPITV